MAVSRESRVEDPLDDKQGKDKLPVDDEPLGPQKRRPSEPVATDGVGDGSLP